MSRIYCGGCANLLMIKQGEGVVPLCLARARFVSGPLRSDVDVVGFTLAEEKNHFNNCLDRKKFRPRVRKLKDWLLRSMNNGNEIGVEDYPRETEKAHYRKIREKLRAQKAGREEEAVVSHGGTDDSVGAETSDQERGQLLLDLQSDDGSGGESLHKHLA